MAKYVLVEVGWEYNDQTYDTLDSATPQGIPVRIFDTKEEANKERDRLTLYKINNRVEVEDYCYDREKLRNILAIRGFTFDDIWDVTMPETLPDEDKLEILSELNLDFYYVYKIEE